MSRAARATAATRMVIIAALTMIGVPAGLTLTASVAQAAPARHHTHATRHRSPARHGAHISHPAPAATNAGATPAPTPVASAGSASFIETYETDLPPGWVYWGKIPSQCSLKSDSVASVNFFIIGHELACHGTNAETPGWYAHWVVRDFYPDGSVRVTDWHADTLKMDGYLNVMTTITNGVATTYPGGTNTSTVIYKPGTYSGPGPQGD